MSWVRWLPPDSGSPSQQANEGELSRFTPNDAATIKVRCGLSTRVSSSATPTGARTCVYFEGELDCRSAAHLLTRDEARRIAVNSPRGRTQRSYRTQSEQHL